MSKAKIVTHTTKPGACREYPATSVGGIAQRLASRRHSILPTDSDGLKYCNNLLANSGLAYNTPSSSGALSPHHRRPSPQIAKS